MPGGTDVKAKPQVAGPNGALAIGRDTLADPLETAQIADPLRGRLAPGPGAPRRWNIPLPTGPRPGEVEAMRARNPDTAPSLAALDLAGHTAPKAKPAIPASATFARMAAHIPDNAGFGYSGAIRQLVDPELVGMVSPGANLAPQPDRPLRGKAAITDPIERNNGRKAQSIRTMMVPPSVGKPAFYPDRDVSDQPALPDTKLHLSDDARRTFHAVPSNVALTSYANKKTGQIDWSPLIPDSGGKSAALDHEDILHPDLVVHRGDRTFLNKPIRHTDAAARAGNDKAGQSSHEQVATRFEGTEGVAAGVDDLVGFTTHKGDDGGVGAMRWTSRTLNDRHFKRYESDDERDRRVADEQARKASASPIATDLDTSKLKMNAVLGGLALGRKGKGKGKPARVGGLGTGGKLSETWRNALTAAVTDELGQSERFVSDEIDDPRARHRDDGTMNATMNATAPTAPMAPMPGTAPLPTPIALPTLAPRP